MTDAIEMPKNSSTMMTKPVKLLSEFEFDVRDANVLKDSNRSNEA